MSCDAFWMLLLKAMSQLKASLMPAWIMHTDAQLDISTPFCLLRTFLYSVTWGLFYFSLWIIQQNTVKISVVWIWYTWSILIFIGYEIVDVLKCALHFPLSTFLKVVSWIWFPDDVTNSALCVPVIFNLKPDLTVHICSVTWSHCSVTEKEQFFFIYKSKCAFKIGLKVRIDPLGEHNQENWFLRAANPPSNYLEPSIRLGHFRGNSAFSRWAHICSFLHI